MRLKAGLSDVNYPPKLMRRFGSEDWLSAIDLLLNNIVQTFSMTEANEIIIADILFVQLQNNTFSWDLLEKQFLAA